MDATKDDKKHLKDLIMRWIFSQDNKYLPAFVSLLYTKLETEIFNMTWELKPGWTYLRETGVSRTSIPQVAFRHGNRVIAEDELAEEAKKLSKEHNTPSNAGPKSLFPWILDGAPTFGAASTTFHPLTFWCRGPPVLYQPWKGVIQPDLGFLKGAVRQA